MKKIAKVSMFAALLVAAYLGLWPVPIVPVSWTAPTPPGYTGVHAVNQRLAGARQIALGGEVGPEHVLAGPDGKLYRRPGACWNTIRPARPCGWWPAA